MGETLKRTSFFNHDFTVCDAKPTFPAHKALHRVKMTEDGGGYVVVWKQEKLFIDGTMDQQSPALQIVIVSVGEVDEYDWDPNDSPTMTLQQVLQYKVGTWQGDEIAWTTRTATGGL